MTRPKRKYTRKAVKEAGSAKYAESGSVAAEGGLRVAEGGMRVAEGGMRVAEGGESAQDCALSTRVKQGAGRPPTYSKEIWKDIFDKIGTGASLTTAIKGIGISYSQAQRVLDANPELQEAYEKAQKIRAARLAEEIIELSDAPIPDHLQGVEISAWVNQKRLQVDARKWVAAKLYPRVYGDKIDVSVRDDRISVLDALEAARSRVQIGMDITDVTPKLSTGQR